MRTAARGTVAALLVLAMAVGSILMWIGVPVFWLWLASRIADSSQPSLGLYLLVLVGIVASMAILGKVLGTANRIHMEITGSLPQKREQTIWLRSMRGEREVRRQTGVLGLVMAWSVSVALLLFGIWFFFFAEGGGI
ncbi:MAG TPA: hypothetical protein VGW75_05485 [Solirubrobacteraceae bacterium]|jgi:hypothetical protein|nr:hypothetical protein [Solirubrobacteraceae bacterium]